MRRVRAGGRPREPKWRLMVVCMMAAASWMGGCGKKPPPATAAPEPGAQPPVTVRPAAAAFCVVELVVEQAAPAAGQIAGLEAAVTAALPANLLKIDGVVAAPQGDQPPQAAACSDKSNAAGRVGVLIRFDHTLLGGDRKVYAPRDAAQAELLALAVMAHAERRGADGRAEVAEAHVAARVPMPARHAANLAAFAEVRVLRAASLAVTDALGQLWVRPMTDAQVRALLDETAPFKRAAAVREIGERGIIEAREQVEAAALGSRSDLAVVAAAALGRLGQPASLPTLSSCLESASPEVADAAVLAISEIADPTARKMLERVAREHRLPWIRQRASALLER